MAPPRRDDEAPTDVRSASPLVVTDDSTGPHAVAHQLICVAGPDVGRTFSLVTPTVTIGRGPVDISLRATDVSRNHARLFRRGSDYAIEDLGSANQTFVNGQALTSSVTLRQGDRIQLGETVFVFALHDELEHRLQQVQRTEGLATFAASIAHDFNNALSVIISGLSLIENKLRPTNTLTDVLADMRTAAVGSSQLAVRLMQLGRIGETPDLEPVELASLVNRTAGVMRRRVPASMLVTVEVPEGLVVPGVEVDLHLVLMNLILNARDAMPTGGTLTISAQRSTLDAAQAAAAQVPAPGEYAALRFTDTGQGMDAATQARVFEPFFTTKPPGQGTGLGLAMVQGIVKRHRGAISVESSVGAGSTFTIWLPVG